MAVCQSGAIRSCALARIQFSHFQYADFYNALCVGRSPKTILVAAFRRNVQRNQTVTVRIRKKVNNEKKKKKRKESIWSICDNYSLSFNAEVSQLLQTFYEIIDN